MKTDHIVSFWLVSAVLVASVSLPLPGADGTLLHLPSLCPFYELTGLPCPGCGLTRAFVCIGHGQWGASLRWHPLGLVLYAACVVWWGRAAWSLVSKRPLQAVSARASRVLSGSGLTAVLLTGGGRIVWLVAHHARW